MEYFEDEYVVVDLETTGLSPFNGDEIIEIGVTEIRGDKIHRNYSRLVKPNGLKWLKMLCQLKRYYLILGSI